MPKTKSSKGFCFGTRSLDNQRVVMIGLVAMVLIVIWTSQSNSVHAKHLETQINTQENEKANRVKAQKEQEAADKQQLELFQTRATTIVIPSMFLFGILMVYNRFIEPRMNRLRQLESMQNMSPEEMWEELKKILSTGYTQWTYTQWNNLDNTEETLRSISLQTTQSITKLFATYLMDVEAHDLAKQYFAAKLIELGPDELGIQQAYIHTFRVEILLNGHSPFSTNLEKDKKKLAWELQWITQGWNILIVVCLTTFVQHAYATYEKQDAEVLYYFQPIIHFFVICMEQVCHILKFLRAFWALSMIALFCATLFCVTRQIDWSSVWTFGFEPASVALYAGLSWGVSLVTGRWTKHDGQK